MKTLLHLFIFFSITANAQTPKRLLISHANVIDVITGNVQTNTSILIDGNRIAAIGEKIDPLATDSIIDASGKFVIPGLWDMHTHVLGEYKINFALLLANGITGIRNMHSTVDHPLQALALIRQQLKEQLVLGPRLVANGQIVDGEPAFWPSTYKVHDAMEAKAAVDSLIRGGADFIKVYDDLAREPYFAIAEECKRLNTSFEGHIPYSISLEEAVKAGQKSIEHNKGLLEAATNIEAELKQGFKNRGTDSVIYALFERLINAQDVQKREQMIKLLAKGKVWLCPTLVTTLIIDSAALYAPALKKYSSGKMYKSATEYFDFFKSNPLFLAQGKHVDSLHLTLLKDMDKGGVKLLAGTDIGNPGVVPGFSLHRELAFFVSCGLTPLHALQTATLNPAIFFGKENELGTVEKGKLADLVILNANPLLRIDNTTTIHAVVVNGNYLSRQRLDSLLAYAEGNKR